MIIFDSRAFFRTSGQHRKIKPITTASTALLILVGVPAITAQAQVFFTPPPGQGSESTLPTCVDRTTGRILFPTNKSDCSQGTFTGTDFTSPTGLTVGGSNNTAPTFLNSDGSVSVGGSLTALSGLNVLSGSVNIVNGGLTANGVVNFSNNRVQGVATPTGNTDAANKAYVDAASNGGDKTFNTLVVNTTTNLNGGATFGTGAGQSSFDANGNLIVNGTGPAQFNNGATFTGATTVNGGAFTANAGAVVNNGFTVSGTTNLNGQTNINGGGLTVNGGVVTAQKGIVSNGPNSLNGATTVNGGKLTANAGATVNNGFTSNGPTQVNGATTLNGNVAVTSGNTIDAGGNRIQDVAAPVVGTDAVNKDYVDAGVRRLDRRIDKAEEGIAVASSLANPDRTGDQTWAVAVNWGNYEGNNAVGVSGIAAIGRDFFATGDQVSLGGAVGFSTDGGQVAGRVSVQIAGGGRAPLK